MQVYVGKRPFEWLKVSENVYRICNGKILFRIKKIRDSYRIISNLSYSKEEWNLDKEYYIETSPFEIKWSRKHKKPCGCEDCFSRDKFKQMVGL